MNPIKHLYQALIKITEGLLGATYLYRYAHTYIGSHIPTQVGSVPVQVCCLPELKFCHTRAGTKVNIYKYIQR